MKTGKIEANLVKLKEEFQLSYLDNLIAQKTSSAEKSLLKDAELQFHTQEYQRLQNELELAFNHSHLPNEPSAKRELNDLLLSIRK